MLAAHSKARDRRGDAVSSSSCLQSKVSKQHKLPWRELCPKWKSSRDEGDCSEWAEGTNAHRRAFQAPAITENVELGASCARVTGGRGNAPDRRAFFPPPTTSKTPLAPCLRRRKHELIHLRAEGGFEPRSFEWVICDRLHSVLRTEGSYDR